MNDVIGKSFRRDIEKTQALGRPMLQRLLTLGKGNMAMQTGRRDARPAPVS